MTIQKFINRHQFLIKLLSFISNFVFSADRKIISFYKKNPGNKIVIISIHRIGDTVVTIPAIKKLCELTSKDIVILCYRDSKKIYELVFKNLLFITIDKDNFYWDNRVASSSIRKKLNKSNPEVIIDFTGGIQAASLLIMSAAKRIIGYSDHYYKNLYTDFIPKRIEAYSMDRFFEIVKLYKSFELKESDKIFEIADYKNGVILIHPFAGWAAKEWNLEKFIELYFLLKKNYNCKFIINNNLPSDIKRNIEGHNVISVYTETIDELISEINKCSIFVSNDSGPLYIAALLGKPTFTIYGPTNPDYSLPKGKHNSMIRKKIHCSPASGQQYCYTNAGRDGCPSFECMNQLSTLEVFEKIVSFLNMFLQSGIKTNNIH